MSASLNHAEDDCLNDMLSKLDSNFGNREGLRHLINEAKTALLNVKNGLACEMATEVAQLVLKGEPKGSVKALLDRNFPSGTTIGNVEEMLKLVYVGADTENIKKAINFVEIFDSCHHANAFKALYDDVKFKKHTEQPEMLLLQQKIKQLQNVGSVLDEINKQLDADCRKIISRIVKSIKEKDYSISQNIVKSIDNAVFNNNILTIVHEFFTGKMENILLLTEYSQNMPYVSNNCFIVDALLIELEKNQLLNSEQAMHLWALAKYYSEEETGLKNVEANTQKLCINALNKLSSNKLQFLQYYQKYVEDPDKLKIQRLHNSNWRLVSIISEFVPFYYDGSVVRTRNLLQAAIAITYFGSIGRILSLLYEHSALRCKLNTFEMFTLFNIGKTNMSNSLFSTMAVQFKEPFERLKEKAPACVLQLLWPEKENALEFQLVNKFYNATLGVNTDKKVICDKRSKQTWKIAIDNKTFTLTLTHAPESLQLGTNEDEGSPCLTETGAKWMVKAMDEHHLKIFYGDEGEESFLTADAKDGEGCQSVCLRKEKGETQLYFVTTVPRINCT